MLLCCSTSYCQTSKRTSFFTGGQQHTIEVPIEYIKLADSLLIDRKYLKQEIIIKDDIISGYEDINSGLTKDIANINKENNKLNTKIKIWRWTALGMSVAFIITLIFK